MTDNSELQLSVVLATTHDSATLRSVIVRHEAGLAAVGGELLIGDGSPDGLSQDIETAVHMPGADVFTLRSAVIATAQGRVIAVTEDHCLPAPDWHSAIIRAHDENPNIAAIGGAVLNGSTETAIDRANFLLTFVFFLPPLARRNPTRSSPPVNLSIKNESLREYDLVPGLLEMEIVPHMYRVGHLMQDDRVRVTHVQSHGSLFQTIARHFHNGRSTAAMPFRRPPPRELIVRTSHNLALPFLLIAAYMKVARGKFGYRKEALQALPLVAVFAFAHGAGEFVGTLFGPGNSPKHLE